MIDIISNNDLFIENLVQSNYIRTINKINRFNLFKKFSLKKNLNEKILKSSKTRTVVAGYKRVSTRIVSVVGNNSGVVGLGFGCSTSKIKAHRLSFYKGKNDLIAVPLTHNLSIPLCTSARYCTSFIKLYPVFNFSGLKIGGTARSILEIAGIKNITAITLGSSNVFNIANATMLALIILSQKIERLAKENKYYKNVFIKKLINARNFIK